MIFSRRGISKPLQNVKPFANNVRGTKHRNVDNPYSVTLLLWTLMFVWYTFLCGCKNVYMKDTCQEEIGVCTQNTITIIGSKLRGPI